MLENLFMGSSILGFLLSIALITSILTPHKANFFLGLIVLFISVQLLFSWGSHSDYNNAIGAFPFWIFLTYHILPPSIWLFTTCIFDPSVELKRWYALLFMPAFAEILIQTIIILRIVPRLSLMDYAGWIWFIDYIPLLGLILSLGFFWIKYFQANQSGRFKKVKGIRIPHVKLFLLMSVFTLIGLLWIFFTITGRENFLIIELLLVLLLLTFSFLIFLNSQPFPLLEKMGNKDSYSNYDDQKELKRLNYVLNEKQLFTNPGFSLKDLSQEMNLPSRYLSHLINRYHDKNFKEFINEYRIETFLVKARSSENKYKTLLALAFESGFNSKSSFNQVFKECKGKPPSEYLI
jgi:AraC-like DNA-binding protein